MSRPSRIRRRHGCYPTGCLLLSTILFSPFLCFGFSTPLRCQHYSSRQQQHTRTALHLFLERNHEESITANNNGKKEQPLAFLIERIPAGPTPSIFPEIADMCITAFFNDNNTTGGSKSPFWKEWQLAYLRRLQTGDLQRRRSREPSTNMMFVARRVVPATRRSTAAARQPLLLDTRNVFHLPTSTSSIDYVRSEIVGFVEVTQRPYAIPTTTDDNSQSLSTKKNKSRPVLTNLSVRAKARQSGVGSQLLYACEQAVMKEWQDYEIVLEVEQDNVRAQQFYKKRGYKVLFEDPTSRRYDVSGVWLQQVRCKRLILQKKLHPFITTTTPSSQEKAAGAAVRGMELLQKLRENILSAVVECK